MASNDPPPLPFIRKTIEGIEVKRVPPTNRREINLLLQSYLSCDATSWIFRLYQNAVKTYLFASNLLNNFVR